MEIGAETCASEIADISFEDCDIIRTTHIAMDIQHGDRAAIRDIRFENLRVEVADAVDVEVAREGVALMQRVPPRPLG